MRRRLGAAAGLSAALGAAACGPGAPRPQPPPAGPVLAYALPTPNPARYRIADTAEFRMQATRITIAGAGLVELAFATDGERLRVTARLLDFAGRFASAGGRTVSTDEKGVSGPFVIALDRRGRAEILGTPSQTDAFRQISGADDLVQDLFVRLPGGPMRPGGSWTDTLTSEEVAEGVTTYRRSLVTSTWSGDSTLAGRTLHVITATSATTVNVSGTSEGLQIRQDLSGTSRSTTLWDPGRSLIVERSASGQLTGTLQVTGSGIAPIPVQGTVKGRVVLQGG